MVVLHGELPLGRVRYEAVDVLLDNVLDVRGGSLVDAQALGVRMFVNAGPVQEIISEIGSHFTIESFYSSWRQNPHGALENGPNAKKCYIPRDCIV